jgi:hypothetical protein
LIIVNTKNGVLVMGKERAHKVKDLVNRLLGDDKLKDYLE